MEKIIFKQSTKVDSFIVRCIETKGTGYYDTNMKRRYLNYGTKYTVSTVGDSNYFLFSTRGKQALGWHSKKKFEIIKIK